jgi:hypothetical protein
MAIMRSEIKKSGGGDWLGIKTGTISAITDESSKYAWADVYLNVEFTVEGSDYPRRMAVAGSFDKEPNGNIKDCSLLKKITHLFDAVGEMGGPNQLGQWVDENEKPIDDIVAHLNQYIGTSLTIYVYKELAKNGQAYTRVHNKVLAVSAKSEEELQGYINFMKSKGFLKEAPKDMNNPAQSVQMNGTGSLPTGNIDIANL